jgi:hypothetical protein
MQRTQTYYYTASGQPATAVSYTAFGSSSAYGSRFGNDETEPSSGDYLQTFKQVRNQGDLVQPDAHHPAPVAHILTEGLARDVLCPRRNFSLAGSTTSLRLSLRVLYSSANEQFRRFKEQSDETRYLLENVLLFGENLWWVDQTSYNRSFNAAAEIFVRRLQKRLDLPRCRRDAMPSTFEWRCDIVSQLHGMELSTMRAAGYCNPTTTARMRLDNIEATLAQVLTQSAVTVAESLVEHILWAHMYNNTIILSSLLELNAEAGSHATLQMAIDMHNQIWPYSSRAPRSPTPDYAAELGREFSELLQPPPAIEPIAPAGVRVAGVRTRSQVRAARGRNGY